MTIQPDDGYEQQRAALGRLYHLMNTTPGDTLTIAEIHEALAGPELDTRTVEGLRWFVHRQTRTPGMLYTADTADAVKTWLDSLTPAEMLEDGQHLWEDDSSEEGWPVLIVTTFHGPVDMRFGDTLLIDPRGGPYPCSPEVLALSYWEEH